jgi:hypothetical protein
MVDYSVDGDFDLHFNDFQDFATVSGREEFEQDLIIYLNDELQDLLGTYKSVSTIEEKITLRAVRIAKQFDIVDRIKNVEVNKPLDATNDLEVVINYKSGEKYRELL